MKTTLLRAVYGLLLSIFLTVPCPSWADVMLSQGEGAIAPLCPKVITEPAATSIRRADLGERIKSKLVLTVTFFMTEPIIVPSALTLAGYERAKSLVGIARAKRADQQASDNVDQLLFATDENYTISALEKWTSQTPQSGMYGSSLYHVTRDIESIDEYKNHFRNVLPENLGEVAANFIDAVYDKTAVEAWANDVRAEVFAAMWNAGVRDAVSFKKPEIREYFLDRVLARRAESAGFSTRFGLPYGIVTLNAPNFFLNHLAQGHLVIDWTGRMLGGGTGDNRTPHFLRGHELAMTYAAERVPHFVDLMKYTGRTMDRDGVWTLMFDNPNMTKSPFWGGFWVETLRNFFWIRD